MARQNLPASKLDRYVKIMFDVVVLYIYIGGSKRACVHFGVNTWLAAHVNCRLPYAASVAPEQPAHPRSLI